MGILQKNTFTNALLSKRGDLATVTDLKPYKRFSPFG